MPFIRAAINTLLVVSIVFYLSGCDGPQTKKPKHNPVPIESGDECHLCGMVIVGFSGPKGEAYLKWDSVVKKFCSTRDLISWYLQPENTPNTQEIYVHDMARSDWHHPDDRHLTDARQAWYVLDSSQRGAMGNTLASFSIKADAERFQREFGGRIVAFSDLTLSIIALH